MKFHDDKLEKLKCCIEEDGIKEWESVRPTKDYVNAVLCNSSLADLEKNRRSRDFW